MQQTTPAEITEPQDKTPPSAVAKGNKAKSGDMSKATPAVASAPAAPAAAEAAADKDSKAKKHKLVRDSFTIPKDEYLAIEELKQRTAKLSKPAKKSELLRAGIKLLLQLDDAALVQAMQAVPAIKTGRPRSEKK